MIFNFVKWKNFKSYGNYYTKIEFINNNVQLIVGENGNGKSTMVDAIIWCFYGKSIASVNEIINRTVKKNCEVEVSFTKSSIEYNIVRYRDHEEHGNKLFLYKNREDISLRNLLDTQNRINEIIQIPYFAMVSSMLFSSETYISFLRSRGMERLKVFDGILNLKLISFYYDLVKKYRKPILDDLREQNDKKIKVESILDTLNQSITDYKEKIKKTLIELKEKKETLNVEEQDLKVRLSSLCKIDHDKEITRNKDYREITEHNNKIKEEVKKEQNNLVDIDIIIRKYNEVNEELEEINEINVFKELQKIDNFNETLRRNTEIDNKILLLQNKIINTSQYSGKIEECKEEQEAISLKVQEMRSNIDKCPTCGQQIGIDLANNLIKEKMDEIQDIISISKEAYNQIEIANENNKKLNVEIQKLILLKEGIPEQSKYEESYLKGLESRISKLENNKIALSQEIKEKESFNKNIKSRIVSLKEKLIDRNVEKSEFDDEFLNNLRDQIEHTEERLREVTHEKILVNEKAKSSYDKKFVEEAYEKIKKLNIGIDAIKDEIKKIENNDLHHLVLQNLFSNKEDSIKRFIIDKMIDIFNDRINFYLPLFFNENIKISFGKDLSEEIIIDKTIVSFNTFSSGEKTRLELAIAFSLFMLIKTFFSASINLLVFDEILDQNLDQRGVESVLEIINNFAKQNSIVVISHREAYKESFSDPIIARKVDGFSRLTKESF